MGSMMMVGKNDKKIYFFSRRYIIHSFFLLDHHFMVKVFKMILLLRSFSSLVFFSPKGNWRRTYMHRKHTAHISSYHRCHYHHLSSFSFSFENLKFHLLFFVYRRNTSLTHYHFTIIFYGSRSIHLTIHYHLS